MNAGLLKPWAVLAAAAAVACLPGYRLLAAANDAENVRNVVAGFATSWDRHDMDAFGKLFAPDAEFVNVAGDLWTGRQSIQAQHAYAHGVIPVDSPGFTDADRPYYGIFKGSTMKFDQIDVRFLRNDVAVAHVHWELLGDARTRNPRRGMFLYVLTRESGTWYIAVAQNTEINRTVN